MDVSWILDWSEQKHVIKNCNSSVHKILSLKTYRCYGKRSRTSCPFWPAVFCAPQLRWMPCCLESVWLYNYVNWWTSHENWFKSSYLRFFFSTTEAFKAVNSAKSFNLGAPVKNQLNWIDKIKLFFSSRWQDPQTSTHSQRTNANLSCCEQPDSPEEAPETPHWFPSTGSVWEGPRAQVPDHTRDKRSLLEHKHQRCSEEDPAATPLADSPQGEEPAADAFHSAMSDRREQPGRLFCLRRSANWQDIFSLAVLEFVSCHVCQIHMEL